MIRWTAALLASICMAGVSTTSAQAAFDDPDPETDALVDQCFETEGVSMLEGTNVICYNAAIFPEQFLKLNDLPPAERIIITSPGGNVATARGMSTILDRRNEPAVIAGPCMSACAMVILPGLDQVHIHHTAHIAIHGITMIPFGRWWGWLRDDAEPSKMNILFAQTGYDLSFAMHSSGTTHMRDHLKGQGVDEGYIDDMSALMEADARAFQNCRVDVKDYWGIVDAELIGKYLGDRVTRMEAFVQSWDDPANAPYRRWGEPLSERTYIMKGPYNEAGCGG